MKYPFWLLYCPLILATPESIELLKKQPTMRLEAALAFIDYQQTKDISKMTLCVGSALISFSTGFNYSLKNKHSAAVTLYAIGSACLLCTKRINDKQRYFYETKQAIIKELAERQRTMRARL
jgi:hypothetical protein